MLLNILCEFYHIPTAYVFIQNGGKFLKLSSNTSCVISYAEPLPKSEGCTVSTLTRQEIFYFHLDTSP